MTQNSKKSVVIAGGGLAGLAAAVFLDELGYQVTIFEKKPILGGRAFSFVDKQTGSSIDNGQHLLMGAYHETLALLTKVGAKHKVAMQIPTEVTIFDVDFKRGQFVVHDSLPPLNLLKAIFGFVHFSFKEKWAFLKLGWHLKAVQKKWRSIPASLSVQDWLLQHGQTLNTITHFWESLTLATLNMGTQAAPAKLLAEVLIRSYFAGKSDGFLVFPKAGLTEVLIQPILQYLEQRGVKVLRQSGVKSILILDEKVQGFVLDSGEKIKSDIYISALPPQPLQNALPPMFWQNHPELQNLPNFKDSPIASVNLFFDQPVMDDVFVGGANTKTHWFFNRNAIQQNTVAPFHVVAVISAANEFLVLPKAEILKVVLADLHKLCPRAQEAKLLHSLVNIERHATVLLDVVTNPLRPNVQILDNFWLMGDWVNTGLPATLESAVVSAKTVAQSCNHLT